MMPIPKYQILNFFLGENNNNPAKQLIILSVKDVKQEKECLYVT